MENLPTLIHDRFCEDRFLEIWTVDERFIVAIDMVNVTGGTTRYWDAQRLYFISTETLEEVRTLTVMNREWEYDRGLLFQFRDNGIVRVMDIATGTHFNDVHLPFPKDDENVGPWPWASLLSFSSSFGISSSCNLVIDCATGRGCTRPEFLSFLSLIFLSKSAILFDARFQFLNQFQSFVDFIELSVAQRTSIGPVLLHLVDVVNNRFLSSIFISRQFLLMHFQFDTGVPLTRNKV